jgi:hypothetical protein
MSHCSMAIEIFEKTNDGRMLYQTPEQVERYGPDGDGWQLKLIEWAVNNRLNAKGKVLFERLHAQVLAGDYQYPLAEFRQKFCPDL